MTCHDIAWHGCYPKIGMLQVLCALTLLPAHQKSLRSCSVPSVSSRFPAMMLHGFFRTYQRPCKPLTSVVWDVATAGRA